MKRDPKRWRKQWPLWWKECRDCKLEFRWEPMWTRQEQNEHWHKEYYTTKPRCTQCKDKAIKEDAVKAIKQAGEPKPKPKPFRDAVLNDLIKEQQRQMTELQKQMVPQNWPWPPK